MEVTLYKDWMKNQVVDLFVSEYKVDKNEFAIYFDKFYNGVFQKEKSIMIVALDNKTVIGFQTFFYWPYTKNNKTFNSYQSGNSIIHVNYRGKGVFGKLLHYIDENIQEFNIDFIIGFPVDASFNSFIRKGWQNILNLNWHIKKVSILSLISPINYKKLASLDTKTIEINVPESNGFKLFEDKIFKNWRTEYQDNKNYFCFQYIENEITVHLHCKIQNRKRIIKEVIIGNIITNSQSKLILKKAIINLYKELKRKRLTTILSIAINNQCDNDYKSILNGLNFIETNKKINFIIKNYNSEFEEFMNPLIWELYRGDIDTW